MATLMGNDVAVGHVILLGDSIFDNAAYVAGAPDVVRQVRQRLPSGSKATLAAVDGSKIGDVRRQLRCVSADATHLVLSVGGNDALGSSDFLSAPARSTAEALSGLGEGAESGETVQPFVNAFVGGALEAAPVVEGEPELPEQGEDFDLTSGQAMTAGENFKRSAPTIGARSFM